MTDKAIEALVERLEKARSFGDYYRVTEAGEIWSNHSGQWKRLRPHPNPSGYLAVQLTVGGISKTYRVNRVVCEAFHGPPPFTGAMARHLDDDKSNNSQSNLAWGSGSDNAKDAVRNGRSAAAENGRKSAALISGERGVKAVLTWPKVREIRARRAAGALLTDLAAIYGVDHSNIWQICQGKTWREGVDA